MKRLIGISILAISALGLAFAQDVRVGLAFDAGGKNDGGFNQSAFEGSQKAKKDLGVSVFDFEPSDPSQVGQGIRQFSSEGFDLVVGVGFNNTGAIEANAKEFTDVKYAVVDGVPGNGELPNAVGLVFREQEGSFLVGYISGMTTATGVVGFLGGMDIPLIHKFEAGFTQGAKLAFKERKITGRVIANYTGNTPAAWNDPAKAKEIATAQVKQGADIIYSAAGGSYRGALDYIKSTMCISQANLPKGKKFLKAAPKFTAYPAYAKKCKASTTRPLFLVGVDKNQNPEGDTDKNSVTLNHVLTSMMKRVDIATFEVIKSVKEGSFKPGVREFGLNNNGISFSVDKYNKGLLSTALLAKVDSLKKQIIAGKIKVNDK